MPSPQQSSTVVPMANAILVGHLVRIACHMCSVSASHRWTRWIPIGLMLLVGALFLGAPTGGEFYWSEAPRNALNGVFVKDLLKAMPWHNPIGFAYRHYAQYPALTILFYPPLFYILAAPFYALLGVSHGTVLVVVMLHYMAFAWGEI